MSFLRFPDETLHFVRELRANNNREWFHAHSKDYENFYVAPAKEFVEEAGRQIRSFIPDIRAEPKILGSIFRINRDSRYAKQGKPYKDHLDFWFWEGERKEAVSGLFVRIAPEFVGIGAGCHGFDKERLEIFREAVANPRLGELLVEEVTAIENAGYVVQGYAYKRLPSVQGPEARFLHFKALYVHTDEPAQIATQNGKLMAACVRHWRALGGLHRWLTSFVQFRKKNM